MTYSKAKAKRGGDEASSCFRPLRIGNFPNRFLPIWAVLWVSFKHILISPTSFLGIPYSMRILYNTSPVTES
jgi:hypothetical protein